MLDIIESKENAAENRFYEITKGLPEGKFKCPDCGKTSDLSGACASNPDPYSMPICGDCMNN